MTSTKNEFRVNNFDLLRIIAASQVVLGHTVDHLDIRHPWGWSVVEAFPGVPIFFGISGFLISASYERSSSLLTYGRNRVLRIYPGLWVVVTATAVVMALYGFGVGSVKGAVWYVAQLVGMIFTPGFLQSFGFGSYNGALWTIPIELQFYFLLPLLYLATRRVPETQRTKLFVGAFAVFAVIAFVYASNTRPLAVNEAEAMSAKLLRYSFIPHFSLFLAGVLLHRFQVHTRSWVRGKALYYLAGYLVVFYALPRDTALHYTLTTTLLTVVSISVAYTAPGIAERLLRGNDISYGIYIFHGLVLNIIVEEGGGGHLWYVPMVWAITAAIAFASWRLVEQPVLRRKRTSLRAGSVSRAAA
jgi:peptidoglycan/LPS O-acetylase OafA/YrhL